ncbi:hypothetical protein L596_014253 [Steinernema carpocapsae]|uniref:Uncharacterized protein n=1 Tax=Steinernema carpocapsae TaxID=34508 RepID=A0A4U5NBK5_STECR|nr:hypothetical protein L596_014253 [Steinernema carpocapsae]
MPDFGQRSIPFVFQQSSFASSFTSILFSRSLIPLIPPFPILSPFQPSSSLSARGVAACLLTNDHFVLIIYSFASSDLRPKHFFKNVLN